MKTILHTKLLLKGEQRELLYWWIKPHPGYDSLSQAHLLPLFSAPGPGGL